MFTHIALFRFEVKHKSDLKLNIDMDPKSDPTKKKLWTRIRKKRKN